MDAAKVAELKTFIQLVEKNPNILADPSLKFFRDYIERLGGKLPAAGHGGGASSTQKPSKAPLETDDDDIEDMDEEPRVPVEEESEAEEPEVVESEVELDNMDMTVEPDTDPPQQMGDATVEVTDEMREAAQAAKSKAMEALAEENYAEALQHLTVAIVSNPSSSILYGNRAMVLVKMKKPNAAIRDCDAALKLNPDSARAYKSRGEAKALLGMWEAAAEDLRLASRLDYDEEVAEFQKKVEPNAHRLQEHRRKYERLRKERVERVAEKERNRRKKAAQAAYEAQKRSEEARKQSQQQQQSGPRRGPPMPGGGFGGMPTGMGFGGGMPGGMGGGGMPDMSQMLNDPELMAALQDPEVMAALQDVMKNPANLAKHQSNPKVAPLIRKFMGKFGSP
eukprot:TRINITY_DN76_c0_g1_i3.p1 TRINITY_DN76_c0_g1~~TRINITY_DN76_c0_g1_i3.p1  ORF type:complete len:394 (-),score=132.66 TRINITY_DN76_c0_g1_i3:197-1378(-)